MHVSISVSPKKENNQKRRRKPCHTQEEKQQESENKKAKIQDMSGLCGHFLENNKDTANRNESVITEDEARCLACPAQHDLKNWRIIFKENTFVQFYCLAYVFTFSLKF